ncbi:MAG: hypothetical protein ABR962_08745 [Candidatus Bathyarchaeia archaeon]|jgi:hypothetical protein
MAKLSKLIALTIVALLGISVFAGSAMAMGNSDKVLHIVEVDLTGSMRLGWWNVQADNITVQQNFTAKVPTGITPGNYNATFEGFARIDEKSVEFNGVIETENGTFMADFAVPNTYTNLPTGECGALGKLTLLISETALPPPVQYECIQVVGRVTGFGNSNASGVLHANAKISNSTGGNVSEAQVTWVPLSGPMPRASPQWAMHNATGNYTYSFYTATLISTTVVALNYSGDDFYVSGLWNVRNVTFSYSGASYENFKTVTSVIGQNDTGVLEVYGNGKNFTLSIAGFNKVTGSVERFVINAKTILEGDVLNHGVVDIFDLVYVARRFGETPGDPKFGGLSNFDDVEKADVNNDFQVNVFDLVTVATEIGQTG